MLPAKTGPLVKDVYTVLPFNDILCGSTSNFDVFILVRPQYVEEVLSDAPNGPNSFDLPQGFQLVSVVLNGTQRVKAKSTNCSSESAWSNWIHVHFGPPVINSITVNTAMCTGYGQTVAANLIGYPTSVGWYVNNPSNTYFTDYGDGTAYFNSYITDCYGLTISASNACGSIIDGTTICVDACYSRYSVYPNPTKDFINVELGEIRNRELLPEWIELFEEKSVTKIKSISVKAAFDKNTLKSDGIFLIEVSDLPRGIYYLHIKHDGNSKQKTQIIRVILE